MSKRARLELPHHNETVSFANVFTVPLAPLASAVKIEQLPFAEEPADAEPEDLEDAIIDNLSPTEYYDIFVKKTPEEALAVSNAPQRSELWKQARESILTASNFGSATGNNPHMSPEALVKDKLWNEFKGNRYTEYGNEHEPDARNSFLQYIRDFDERARLEERNLITTSECPWLGISPDNFLHWSDGTIDLVEYKCPYFCNNPGHPYNKYTNNVPPYYYDQMQGIMGYMNQFGNMTIRRAWFVVWTPKLSYVTCFEYDPEYWTNMYQKLHQWYFCLFLPSLTHKHNGLLSPGEIKPNCPLVV